MSIFDRFSLEGQVAVVTGAGGLTSRGPIMQLTREEWHRTIAINLTSIFTGSMAAARHMNKGSIINITSGAGSGPVPGSTHYGAASWMSGEILRVGGGAKPR